MSRFLQLRLLWRRAASNPGFTLVALATLAVGIGANVAIFTVVNAVLLRPLPIPDSERLVMLRHAAPGLTQLDELPMSDALYFLYAEESRTLGGVAVFRDLQASFTGPENPQRVQAARVTASFFDVVRTPPRIGRAFTPEDDRPGAAPVAVLADGLWRTRFGADPGVVGTVVDIDGASVEVVGVMPPGFSFSRPNAELWLPMALNRDDTQLGAFGINGVARIADGSTLAQAQAELGTMLSNLVEVFPDAGAAPILANAGFRPVVDRAREVVVGDIEATLWMLLGAVGFLLLIACANVANLFLVRSEARHGEVAIRSALGEGRGRLAGSVLVESVALGVAGGLASLPLAWLAVGLLGRFGPRALPRLDEISIDAPVLGFALAASVAAGVLFGVLPAWRTRAVAAAGHTTAGARGASAGRERQLARRALVVVQIALALTLLVGSGLAVRSFQRLAAVDPGFDATGVLTFGLALPLRDYETAESRLGFHRQVVDRLRALPGIAAAASATTIPLGGELAGSGHTIEGRPLVRRRGAAGVHVEARLAGLLRRHGHGARRGAGVRRARRGARRGGGHRVAGGGAGAVAGGERGSARGFGWAVRRPRKASNGPAWLAWSATSTRWRCTRTRRRWRTTRFRGSSAAWASRPRCSTWCAPRTPRPSPARRGRRCAGSIRRSPSPTSRPSRRWSAARGGSGRSSWSCSSSPPPSPCCWARSASTASSPTWWRSGGARSPSAWRSARR